MNLRLVPELLCQNVSESTAYFVDVLGFTVKYERPDELFVFLTRDGLDVMLEGVNPSGRQWVTAALVKPLGRGINFQCEVKGIDELYSQVQKLASETIYLSMESKDYLCGDEVVTQRQFIVQVPDGYLFRFCEE